MYVVFLSFIGTFISQPGLSWTHHLNPLSPSWLMFQPHHTTGLILNPRSPFQPLCLCTWCFLCQECPAFSFLTGDLLEVLNRKFKLLPWKHSDFYSILLSCVMASTSFYYKYVDIYPSISPISLIPHQGSALFFFVIRPKKTIIMSSTRHIFHKGLMGAGVDIFGMKHVQGDKRIETFLKLYSRYTFPILT